ncbi:MAG: HlyD family efflux transporter periplasmic adaptor subunit [Cyanobacteriota/Melainabacteria group bacterium]
MTAPCDGRVVRSMVAGAGETVSAGTQMAVIAPATNDLAAELLVKGNDAPLIAPGRPVRLQFAGCGPGSAVYRLPSVAGTFAGRVSVVDAVDDGTGKFRIIVVPDEKAVELNEDQPQLSSQFLRPGSEVHGWVMLNTVPLGFELWRQFNELPPSLKKRRCNRSSDVKRKTK